MGNEIEKWLPISEVEILSHDAPVGHVGLRVRCFTTEDGSQTESFPSREGATWPFPEDKAGALVRSLARAQPHTPIENRPRIGIRIVGHKGAFIGFWPEPSRITDVQDSDL